MKKKALLQQLADEKAASGPSKSTRSQQQDRDKDKYKTAGRVQSATTPDASSMTVVFYDCDESISANGRADDGADERIVSARIADEAVTNGIGRIKKIKPVTMQVSLKVGSDAEKFTFSRTWTPTRIVMKLAAGPLALLNVELLVADADLAAEDVLIGLPVLRHLGVDTKTLLEERRDLLNGMDCSSIPATEQKGLPGRVGRLMIARLNRI